MICTVAAITFYTTKPGTMANQSCDKLESLTNSYARRQGKRDIRGRRALWSAAMRRAMLPERSVPWKLSVRQAAACEPETDPRFRGIHRERRES
jgi:hypothetical protein